MEYVCECGREFVKAQSLNGHYSHCKIHCAILQKDVPVRKTGFHTASAEERTFRSKKGKLTMKESGISLTRKLSFAHKQKLSLYRSKAMENNELHCKWYEVDGKKVQGTWEKRVAERLCDLSIKWERVRLQYDGHRHYTPDFFLPELNLYIEVKGWWKSSDHRKMEAVLKEHSIDIRVIEKESDLSTFEIDKLQNYGQLVKR